jgi:mannose-1-phosphate guanylyltransferase
MTGYGYIESGEDLGQYNGYQVFQVNSFREKPDLATAEAFVSSGRFYWNSGMFIWQVSTVMAEIERQLPKLYAALFQMEELLGTGQDIGRIWSTIEPISIDFGVMEGAKRVAVLPVDPGWNDVGSWSAVYDEGLRDSQGSNVVLNGEHIAIDTEGCLLSSKKLVATIGVQNLIIVETDDALFVCPRDQAQQVKALVNLLKQQEKDDYL